jgi:light-regulated signal transduction histidine kinase (bacteriophytochrome)
MNYSLEKVTTVAACDTLLELALEDKESLERRRRNLDEAIDNFDERTTDISTEHTAVLALLGSYTTLYGSLPEGKDKVEINLEIKRLEARKAQLDKMVIGYSVYALLGKQVDYNLLDVQVTIVDAYITAVQAKRTALGGN